jgi:hypothetical protein
MWVAIAAAAVVPGRAASGDDKTDAKLELVVIVHADNHEHASASDLEAWFLRKQRRWPNHDVLLPINFPPDTPARRVFDRAVLAMSPDEVARYWLDQRIRDGDAAPREVADTALIVRLVAKLRGAIAYVPADTTLTGVRVVARIRGGELVAP